MGTDDLSGEQFHKRSITLHRHRTSISLEKAYWEALEMAAKVQGIPLIQLIRNIDSTRKGNLASALRLYVLEFARRRGVFDC
ncbi:MAG: hypothetical protein ACD_16C00066G0001 [uncultured bacterium]|nr:MAG: hypothetical protein ACD_16C00066G0001 [uncultured bacterium]OFW68954.1 MAG: hypothetical protein A2X70_06985 [Alphaproteobacteria bacterium GWC2_42_16]OFW73788.1 MAG: hypothetical protein A2Z80_03210 [Alphaproteobacteria bacterium GWA2_41_27]OFW82049.1 MAG: hypothetical protein A3E50_01475 [Alphaproteobacteria bacterium RIFCSPHIGHO2_12_FULL_42_100]OFW85806.1 MAG: hypothetical protein A2W06_02855 [Alphaproteobacteria bacterium RBG_16_42_14]OFW91193.1 MAG: hypothetical protein A3C41_070